MAQTWIVADSVGIGLIGLADVFDQRAFAELRRSKSIAWTDPSCIHRVAEISVYVWTYGALGNKKETFIHLRLGVAQSRGVLEESWGEGSESAKMISDGPVNK